MYFDENLFTYSCVCVWVGWGGGGGGLNDFKFDTFISHFSTDGAASMAVKGLKVYSTQYKQNEERVS